MPLLTKASAVAEAFFNFYFCDGDDSDDRARLAAMPPWARTVRLVTWPVAFTLATATVITVVAGLAVACAPVGMSSDPDSKP